MAKRRDTGFLPIRWRYCEVDPNCPELLESKLEGKKTVCLHFLKADIPEEAFCKSGVLAKPKKRRGGIDG